MASFPEWSTAAPNEIYAFLSDELARVDAALADLSTPNNVGAVRRAALCLGQFFALPDRASHVADQLLQRLHGAVSETFFFFIFFF